MYSRAMLHCQPAAVMLIVPRQAWYRSRSSRLVPQSTRIFLRQTLKTAESSDTYYLRNGDEITVNIDIEGMEQSYSLDGSIREGMEQSYSLDGSIREGMLVITEVANYREMKGLSAQMKMAESLQLGYSFQPRKEGEKGDVLTRSLKFSLEGSNDAITEASYN